MVQMPSQSTTAFVLIAVIIVVTAGLVGWYVSSEPSSQPWGEGPYYEAVATITEVTDGDTVGVDITDILDPHQGISEGSDIIRFAGVDAWELSDPGGPEAKDFVESLCPAGTTIYMDIDDKAHDGYGPYRGKYGRIIAVIYLKVDNNWVNLNAQLVKEDHGEVITGFSSEFNPNDWLSEDYPHVLS